VDVYIAYGTSLDRVREIMLECASQNPDLLKQPGPDIFFSSMGESSCLIQLIARTDDWQKKGRAEASLREKIYTAFMKEGISSGYAQHVVQISNPISNGTPKNS
jgi:potassium-dependent mechanosensitive channel